VSTDATGPQSDATFAGDAQHAAHAVHLPEAEPRGSSGALSGLIDPGWLMLIAGIALIGIMVVLPAHRELEEAKFFARRVDTIALHRAERLNNYVSYIEALDRKDPAVVEALAARHKNMAREGLEIILPAKPEGPMAASTLPELEPAPLRLPLMPAVDMAQLSTIERWAMDQKARPVVLIIGAACILFGLLPWGRMFSRGA